MRFRVLFSHASERVYEDLMHPEVFDHAVDASNFGESIRRAQGVEYELMRDTEQGWLSRKGETPVEVIRRRWG